MELKVSVTDFHSQGHHNSWQQNEYVPDTPWSVSSTSGAKFQLDLDNLSSVIESDWKLVHNSSEVYSSHFGESAENVWKLQTIGTTIQPAQIDQREYKNA